MKEKIAKIAFVVLILAACCPCVASWMALMAGIVYAFIFGGPAFPKFAKKTQKYLLQGCVVGLGFGMNLQAALASGKDGMMFTIISVAAVMILGFIVGKILKVDTKTSYLVSSGTAICGGSAIAAVAPVVDADDKQMSVSLGTIFVLNALALLIFPPLGHYFGLSNQQFGEWAAIAIHDTSSVVGAAAAYSDESLQVAAMVKCTRALWILPLALVTMLFFRKNSGKGKLDVIPWFIFLFAIAMVINTYLFPAIGVPSAVGTTIVTIAKRGFAITLFLIGTGLSKAALQKCGAKPFIQGVILWAAIGVGSLLAIKGF
ncbi:MAG: putative sulfate exporter family transporter [Fibrobacter sp.]|uniref:YeiH family protein n=1 Tax=Fibrobacter sp. TaxID=35828 RepID=UPI0025B85D49|nr:putative sulfate exporter family transporter [Fibrobacter sp.]MBS7273314.1 putative sulfate exporter family transporter [Fibrobacter sp.]